MQDVRWDVGGMHDSYEIGNRCVNNMLKLSITVCYNKNSKERLLGVFR